MLGLRLAAKICGPKDSPQSPSWRLQLDQQHRRDFDPASAARNGQSSPGTPVYPRFLGLLAKAAQSESEQQANGHHSD
ncbi:hypothetical protein PtB15_18B285 [Puccinia triticina]|nr:hypothetical protein PtB15_18B285 [Puccinia triticina]